MKQTLYFAVYINVTNYSSQKAQQTLAATYENLTNSKKDAQHDLRYFVFPVRDQDTKMELLYPSPFLTSEQAEVLYAEYYDKFKELINKINT